jgi:hypothetical protein
VDEKSTCMPSVTGHNLLASSVAIQGLRINLATHFHTTIIIIIIIIFCQTNIDLLFHNSVAPLFYPGCELLVLCALWEVLHRMPRASKVSRRAILHLARFTCLRERGRPTNYNFCLPDIHSSSSPNFATQSISIISCHTQTYWGTHPSP